MSKDYFNDLIEKTLRLVAINSVQDVPCSISPFGKGVGLCLLETEKICKEYGFETHNEEGYYVTASIGSGEEFGILGHVDTVPFDAKAWSVNPLGEIKRNRHLLSSEQKNLLLKQYCKKIQPSIVVMSIICLFRVLYWVASLKFVNNDGL